MPSLVTKTTLLVLLQAFHWTLGQKALIAQASSIHSPQLILQGGDQQKFSFGPKTCRLTLETNGNLILQSQTKKNNRWNLEWESGSKQKVDDMTPRYYLQLEEYGRLAIYQISTEWNDRIIWSFSKKGVEYLYMNKNCVLSLENKEGMIHWTSQFDSVPPTWTTMDMLDTPPLTPIVEPLEDSPISKRPKQLVLMASNHLRNSIQAGEPHEYRFSKHNQCRLMLERNGNLWVQSYNSEQDRWDIQWDSQTNLHKDNDDDYVLHLNKNQGLLGIYQTRLLEGNDMKQAMIWSPMKQTKGLKYLYMNEGCELTLEKDGGLILWTSKGRNVSVPPTVSPLYTPNKPKPLPLDHLSKQLVMTASNHVRDALPSGERRDYPFQDHICSLTLTHHGNLMMQSHEGNDSNTIWNSGSKMDGKGYLSLKKNGVLAIYQESNVVWMASKREKGIHYLYIGKDCHLTLENKDGMVHWSTRDISPIVPDPIHAPVHFKKKLIFIASNHFRNSLKSGEEREFKFPKNKKCSLTLTPFGNLMIQSYSTTTQQWILEWESKSKHADDQTYYLHLHKKKGILAIYGEKSNEIIWATEGKGIKALYMNEKCHMVLEKLDGSVYWTSYEPQIETVPPTNAPTLFPTVLPTLEDYPVKRKALVLMALPENVWNSMNAMKQDEIREYQFPNNKCRIMLEKDGNLLVQSQRNVHWKTVWESGTRVYEPGVYYVLHFNHKYGNLMIESSNHWDLPLWTATPGVGVQYLYMSDACHLMLETEAVQWTTQNQDSHAPVISPSSVPTQDHASSLTPSIDSMNLTFDVSHSPTPLETNHSLISLTRAPTPSKPLDSNLDAMSPSGIPSPSIYAPTRLDKDSETLHTGKPTLNASTGNDTLSKGP